MYLRTRDPFGQTQASYSTLQGPLSEAPTAEQRITEDDFEAVLTVLAGASPWQQYVRS